MEETVLQELVWSLQLTPDIGFDKCNMKIS